MYMLYTCIYMCVYIGMNKMRVWLSGKISPCQGEDAGSIPATRPFKGMK